VAYDPFFGAQPPAAAPFPQTIGAAPKQASTFLPGEQPPPVLGAPDPPGMQTIGAAPPGEQPPPVLGAPDQPMNILDDIIGGGGGTGTSGGSTGDALTAAALIAALFEQNDNPLTQPTVDAVTGAVQSGRNIQGLQVPGITPSFQSAIDLSNKNVGAWQPDVEAARGFTTAGGAPMTQEDIARYMNPYTELALDPAARKIKEQAAIQRQMNKAKSAARGAFGTERQTQLEGLDSRNELLALQDLYGTGFGRAFDTAVSSSGADRARQLQAAGISGDTASRVSTLGGKDVEGLMTAGGIESLPYTQTLAREKAASEALSGAAGAGARAIGSTGQPSSLTNLAGVIGILDSLGLTRPGTSGGGGGGDQWDTGGGTSGGGGGGGGTDDGVGLVTEPPGSEPIGGDPGIVPVVPGDPGGGSTIVPPDGSEVIDPGLITEPPTPPIDFDPVTGGGGIGDPGMGGDFPTDPAAGTIGDPGFSTEISGAEGAVEGVVGEGEAVAGAGAGAGAVMGGGVLGILAGIPDNPISDLLGTGGTNESPQANAFYAGLSPEAHSLLVTPGVDNDTGNMIQNPMNVTQMVEWARANGVEAGTNMSNLNFQAINDLIASGNFTISPEQFLAQQTAAENAVWGGSE